MQIIGVDLRFPVCIRFARGSGLEKTGKYWSARSAAGSKPRPGSVAFSGGINTPRLRLRRLTRKDAPTIARLVSDWEVSKQTISISNPYTLDDANGFVHSAENDWRDGSQFVLGIERRSDNALIGTVSLQIYRKWWRQVGEIGYWIGREFWREGYTSEAVEAFLVFCKSGIGQRSITARVFAENEASLRLLDKANFRVVAKKVEHVPERGGKRRVIHLRHTLK